MERETQDGQALQAENERLRMRLAETEETLQAIRSGEVDALTDISERERSRREREDYLAKTSTLLWVSTRVLAATDVEEMMQEIVSAARLLTGARLATGGHGYRDGTFQIGATARSTGVTACPPGEQFTMQRGGVYSRLIATPGTIRLSSDELAAQPDWWGLPDGHAPLRGLLGASLLGSSGVAGLLLATDKEHGEFSDADETALAQLAGLASLGLQHIEARQEATRRAEQMEAVFSALADPVLIFDRQGVPVRGNQAARDFLGYDPEQRRPEDNDAGLELAAHESNVRHADGTPLRPDEMTSQRALRGETVLREQQQMTDRFGRERILLSSAAPVHIGDQVEGAVTSWHDVTEREQLVKELARQQVLLETVFEQMPSGVIVADAASETIILASEQLSQIWGRPFDTSVGPASVGDVYPLLHMDGRPYALEERPLRRAMRSGEHVAGEEFTIVRGDGSAGVVSASSAPICDEAGRIVAGVVVLTDITERKRADEQLQRWASIFQYGGWGIATGSTEDATFELLNPAFATMHGYTVAELAGRPIADVFACDARPVLSEAIRRVHEKGHYTFEAMHVRKDGSTFPALVDLTAVKDEHGHVLYRVANVIDLTERKQREALLLERERRLAALESIVGERERIGRDLHDGVAQVMGYMRFKLHAVRDLISMGETAEAKEGVSELEEAACLANADIREAIAGLRLASVLHIGLLASLEEYAGRYEQQWNIKTELVVEPGVATGFTPTVAVQLQSIIHEALSNTRKHAQAQHATIRFNKSGKHTVITIADDGQGFDQEKISGGSYGMGIMRERAALIGAELRIVSRPGEGTRITIQLPAEAVAAEEGTGG